MKTNIQTVSGLSTGSTPLNLACSGIPEWGLVPGGYYLFVGDSGSGKTYLTLGILAEAANNPAFDKHTLVFYNAENGALMDIKAHYGSKLAKRMMPPAGTIEKPEYPTVLETFYDLLDAQLEKGPCVYLLDSMDVLIPKAYLKKLKSNKRAALKGEEATGSYGTDKARLNSDRLRKIIDPLRDTGSILVILSQTRDRIGFGARFNPKTRGGGNALTFYATLEIWSSVADRIKSKVRGNAVEQGIVCKFVVKKNRETGRPRTAKVSFLHGYGIDDIGDCVDYLVHWKEWKSTEDKQGNIKTIAADNFDNFNGSREKLIELIISKPEFKEQLINSVESCWNDVENELELKREPRYQ